jgi:hypothetical protein
VAEENYEKFVRLFGIRIKKNRLRDSGVKGKEKKRV